MSDNPLATWLTERPTDRPWPTAAAGPADERPAAGRPADREPGAAGSEPAPADPAPRTRRLWVLAAIPWAAAAIVGAVVLTDPTEPDPTGPPTPAETPLAAPETEDGRVGPAVPPPPGALPGLEGPRDGVAGAVPADGVVDGGADAEVTAAAAVAVRMALTARDPDGDRYVDLVAADGVTWHGEVAVVTVQLVLLEGRDGVWERTRPARYAVAVHRGGQGVHVVGPPWPISGAAAEPSPTQEAADPVDDEALAAALHAAVGRAGYADVEVRGLLPPPSSTTLRLRVHAKGPGEAVAHVHELLLLASPPHDVLGTT